MNVFGFTENTGDTAKCMHSFRKERLSFAVYANKDLIKDKFR